MESARKALLVASSVWEYPIRTNEQNVVISQKKRIQTRLLEKTSPNMAERKTKSMKKNILRRSTISGWRW